MTDRLIIPRVMKRYGQAGDAHTAFRKSLDALFEQEELKGFKLTELPQPAQGKVHGFDLWFADRCVRLIFTQSNQRSGVTSIVCSNISIAYDKDPTEICVYEVDKDGGAHLANSAEILWIQHPAGVFDLLSNMVETAMSLRV